MIINNSQSLRLLCRAASFTRPVRFYFSEELSKEGMKAILATRWINIIVNERFTNDFKSELCIRDIILGVKPEDIREQIHKQSRVHFSGRESKGFHVDLKSEKFIDSFKEMRSFFKEGFPIDTDVYQQNRITEGLKTNVKSKELFGFFPTRFTTSENFTHVLEKKSNQQIVFGTAGTGKTISYIMLKVLADYTNFYFYSSLVKKTQFEFLLKSRLIENFPKIFYISLSSDAKKTLQPQIIKEQILRQCTEIDPNTLSQDLDLGDFCAQIRLRYFQKNIKTFLIIDQINAMTAAIRKYNLTKDEKQKRLAENNQNNLAQVCRLSKNLLFLSSNNGETSDLFKNTTIYDKHTGLRKIFTVYSHFDQKVKRQLLHYFLFQLSERHFVSEDDYQKLKTSPKILKQWNNLDLLSVKATPLYIRSFLSGQKISQKNEEQIIQMMKQFSTKFNFQVKQQVESFLTKSNAQINFKRWYQVGNFLSLSKKILQIKEKLKPYQKDILSVEEISQKQELNKELAQETQQFRKKIIVQKENYFYKDNNHSSRDQLYHKDLFLVQYDDTEGQVMYQVQPSLSIKDFHYFFNPSYAKLGSRIIKKWFQVDKFGSTKYYVRQIINGQNGGIIFERIILNALEQAMQNQRQISAVPIQPFMLAGEEVFSDFKINSSKDKQDFQKLFETAFTQDKRYFQQSQSILYLPATPRNPVIDFIIANFKKESKKELKKRIIFHAFDVTKTRQDSPNYVQKIINFVNKFKQFKEFDKPNSKQQKNQWVTSKKSSEIQFQVNFYVLGLRKSEQISNQIHQLSKLNGIGKICYMNIHDLRIIQKQKEMSPSTKLLEQIKRYFPK